ncbi:MAG: hypothetical protein ABII90_11405 [Bacteroidota bacterium]
MSTAEIRTDLLNIFKNTRDERFLKIVHALAKAYRKDEIVAYTADGIPLTKEQYIKEIEEAEAQIERGEYITMEELEKESKKW